MTFRTLRTTLTIALIVSQLLAGGCASKRLGHVPWKFRDARESGIAVIGDEYTFSANTRIRTDEPVLITAASNEKVKYGNTGAYPRFLAYVNPQVAKGSPVDIHVNFTTPMLEIITGWAYMVGVSPMGRTTRVRAVGEGTRMIIECDTSVSPEVHRVYFVGDKRCRVNIFVPADPPPPPATYEPVYVMASMQSYIEVYADNTWKYMGSYLTNPERLAFVSAVIDESRDAISP